MFSDIDRGVSEKFPNTPQGVKNAHIIGGEYWERYVDWWGEDIESIYANNNALVLKALIDVARDNPSLLSSADLRRAEKELNKIIRNDTSLIGHDEARAIGQQATTRHLTIIPYTGTETPISVTIPEPNTHWVHMLA